ncbi:Frag1/DRAM/Sfk1 family protein [Seiridium cupressi]
MMKLLSYWWFPIISGLMWLATLLGLLLHWIIDTHRIHYSSMGDTQHIAYISDVGAAELKPFFVVGCVITTIFLDLSFATDRWLRHKGRLVPNTTMGEKVLSGLTIFFALIGTVAIFICWEYQRLGIKYREHRVLRISFWIKLVFIIVELFLAIAFIVTNFRGIYDVAAILEWVIAFIFSLYVFSFFVDLYPAVKTRNGGMGFKPAGMSNVSPHEMEESYHVDNHNATNPRYTQDSSRPLNGTHGRQVNF